MQLILFVKLEALNHTEAIAKRCGEKPCPRRCTDQGKMRQRKPYTFCIALFSKHNVYCKVFHCRIKHLFNLTVQPMNFVDKEHITLLQMIQDCRHITRLLNGRA